jgi:adenosylcobinamide-GDP ribazoletransferase
MRRWAELVAAATLLTRLPLGGLAQAHPPPSDTVWAFPLVGLLPGLIGAAVLSAAMTLGCPQALAALWSLAALTLATGALHEDGLADTADGFGGAHERARKLDIMRDSRIGSFGALALLFSVTIRAAALAVTPHPVRAVVIAAVLARGAMLLPLLLLHPARAGGLGAMLAARSTTRTIAGLLLAAAMGLTATWAFAAALLAGSVMTALTRRQIGGYTGDTLGATEQLAECAALTVLA